MNELYLDNETKDEDQFLAASIAGNDDLDAPLLINDTLDTPTYSPPCLYGQKGFRQTSIDAQSSKAKRQLIAATTLCFVFMIAELIGGYTAGSLAIITDAAHLLSDCISFIVALLAIWLSKKPADNKMSFGYKRAEVLGALLSVIGIWLLTAVLVYLAVGRLIRNDFDIDADTMIIVSSIGVVINIIMGVVLHGACCSLPHGHSHGGKSPCNGGAGGHNHSHNHTSILLSPADPNGRAYTSLNHNSSRTHSRHNSFTNKLGVKGNGDEHRNSVDLLRTRIEEPPLIHRMSIDGGVTRITMDNRVFSHPRLCEDLAEVQYAPANQLLHRSSVDSSHSSSADSGRPSTDPKQNINIRAAVIHVIGDFIQSIGVLIAAIVIKLNPEAKMADPICTFVFSIIVIFTTIKIAKESLVVLLDGVPKDVALQKLETELSCIQGVRSVHHLNVWSLTIDWNIMSVHLIVDSLAETDEILQAATTIARKGFDIKHTTIQIEKMNELTDINNFVNFSKDQQIMAENSNGIIL